MSARCALSLVLLLASVFSQFHALAQENNVIRGEDKPEVSTKQILPDRGYTIDQVAADSTEFVDAINFQNSFPDVFWVRFKIVNNSTAFQRYYAVSNTDIKNEIYTYDEVARKWESASIAIAAPERWRGAVIPFPPAAATTVYMKVDVSALDQPFLATNSLYLTKESVWFKKANLFFVIWICTLLILGFLILYNFYVYALFRDITYIYYLMMLVGSFFYATGFLGYSGTILPWDLLVTANRPGGSSFGFYDVELFFLNCGVILITFGFAHFTRHYLNARELAPVWDKLIKYFALFFLLMDAGINISTIVGFPVHMYSTDYLNLATIVAMLLNLIVPFMVRKKARKQSNYFLIANMIPISLIGFLAVFFIIRPNLGSSPLWIFIIPSITISIHGFALAVALVFRMKLIREENENQKQLLGLKQVENEKLAKKLELHQREVASATLHVYHKNALLKELQAQINKLNGTVKSELKPLGSTITKGIDLDSDWEKFKLHFESVNPDFFEQLKSMNIQLTPNEQRLCAYISLNLSVKEIATLMNIDPASVRKAKTRLKKKIPQLETQISG